MCPDVTSQRLPSLLALVVLAAAAQTPPPVRPDWRPIGVPLVDLELASAASGPVERVWFAADGERLLVRTARGRIFQIRDGERWEPAQESEPPALQAFSPDSPWLARVFPHPLDPLRRYALGADVYRSDDGGRTWVNLTRYRGRSIIGDGVRDLTVSPRDPDVIAVANDFGVWRSLDGGLSWTGLNVGLPNLPARRILAVPVGYHGIRVELDGVGAAEWAPGERQAWRPVRDAGFEQELRLRRDLSSLLGGQITAVSASGDFLYAGAADGRIWVSPDRGQSWRLPPRLEVRGPIGSIWVDTGDPRLALASLEASGQVRLLRTTNGGLFWDDLTANLPEGVLVHGVTADKSSGAIYLATDQGIFYTRAALEAPGPATPWVKLPGELPSAPVRDVKLDPDGNQLYVLVEGYGVFVAMAPHRSWSWKVVNGADYSSRPVAPGALLGVLGLRVDEAAVGSLTAPVLASSATESQIQLPFEIEGGRILLALRNGTQTFSVGLPLESASPSIFVDHEGSPLVLDAASGVLLDAMKPARSGSRIQVLATGLGKVRPPWPAGLAAPLEDPPAVVAPVRAYLDRLPVEVTRATLAPGYAGLYLVEIQLPDILNWGPAELYLESEGKQSNRVRIYLEP